MSNKSIATIATMGIDIGKNSFHVVGLDQRGAIVLWQKWSRGQIEARLANMPPFLIGMEACVGAHHLSRKLQAHGHDARLMPAKYVRQTQRFHTAWVIKRRSRPHRLMTAVPSIAEDLARPGRGAEAAPQCRSLPGCAKNNTCLPAPSLAISISGSIKQLMLTPPLRPSYMRIHQADEFALHDERCLRQTAILLKVPEVRARLSIPNW
jgi:hypothetical protein